MLLSMVVLASGVLPAMAAGYDSVQYTVVREDMSIKDENGNLILLQYYDNVVITDKGAAIDKINAQLAAEKENFLRFKEEAETFALEMKDMGRLHKHYASLEVMKNENGILSIRVTSNIYSGGGQDVDNIKGMNFNLRTGESRAITENFSMSEKETERYLKDMTISFVKTSPAWVWCDSVSEQIENKTIKDYVYYLQGDTLYLCYEIETLGPKGAGATVVGCPLKSIKVTYNGQHIYFDQQPIMQSNRVMVPIRAIFETMGYTVTWDQETQTAYADHGTRSIAITVGDSVIRHADGTYTCDVAPMNVAGRILVPVRAVADLSGHTITWDQENLTARISK